MPTNFKQGNIPNNVGWLNEQIEKLKKSFSFLKNTTVSNTSPAMTLSTYADNTAALAGGLVVGDIYKTATGEVRIVV